MVWDFITALFVSTKINNFACSVSIFLGNNSRKVYPKYMFLHCLGLPRWWKWRLLNCYIMINIKYLLLTILTLSIKTRNQFLWWKWFCFCVRLTQWFFKQTPCRIFKYFLTTSCLKRTIRRITEFWTKMSLSTPTDSNVDKSHYNWTDIIWKLLKSGLWPQNFYCDILI